MGLFVAGVVTPLNSSEFTRADCAPRTNALLGTLPLGDGRLSVADWTQAGRYAAALDPLTPAGGPEAPGSAGVLAGQPMQGENADRMSALPGPTVRVVGRRVALGQPARVAVELLASGEENAVGFSLDFDPAQLRYEGTLGVAGASLQVNTNQAAQGRVGVVLARAVGQSFGTGAVPVAQVKLCPIGSTGEAPVRLGDAPVLREIASIAAEVLPAAFEDGMVRVIRPGRLGTRVRLVGGAAELAFTGQTGERYRIEASSDLQQWTLVTVETAGAGPILVRDAVAGSFQQRFYRAVPEP